MPGDLAGPRELSLSDRQLRRLRDAVAGGRIGRVVERPHEVRVYLVREAEESAYLRFWPAAAARVAVLSTTRPVTSTTIEADGDDERVRLSSGGEPVLDATAPSWTWHPYDTYEDRFLWQLAGAEKEAVLRAVEGVVVRADPFPAETSDGRRLFAPPPPFEEWEGSVLRGPGFTEVLIELFEDEGQSDLTLRIELRHAEDGRVVADVRDLHML